MVADVPLDKAVLQEVLPKTLKATEKRSLVRFLDDQYRVNERRAARVIGIVRSSLRHRSNRPRQAALLKKIREVAEARIRFGSRWEIHLAPLGELEGE